VRYRSVLLAKSCPMSEFDWLFFFLFFLVLFSCFEEESVAISFVEFKPNLILDFSTSVLACPVPLL